MTVCYVTCGTTITNVATATAWQSLLSHPRTSRWSLLRVITSCEALWTHLVDTAIIGILWNMLEHLDSCHWHWWTPILRDIHEALAHEESHDGSPMGQALRSYSSLRLYCRHDRLGLDSSLESPLLFGNTRLATFCSANLRWTTVQHGYDSFWRPTRDP